MLNIADHGGLLSIKYDLLKMLPGSLSTFEEVIFDYKPPKNPGDGIYLTKGELFMDLLNVDHKMMLIDLYEEILVRYGGGAESVIEQLMAPFGYNSLTPLYMILNQILDQMTRTDLHFMRNYTVTEGIQKNHGKWPKAFGSAIFLDSRYLIENSLEMIYHNTIAFVTRNNYSAAVHSQVNGTYYFVKDYIVANNVTEEEYAMMVHV